MSERREIEVACPCCESTLWVDVRTEKVMRHSAKAEIDDFGKPKASTSWDEAAGRVSGRLGDAKDKFDAGLSREHSRKTDLDDLFKKVQKKLDGPADAPDDE